MVILEEVQQLLEAVLAREGWQIAAAEGWAEAAYVATHDTLRVFVKFGVPVPALQRLATLGIAPAVLAAGELRGVPYVVQEFLDVAPPERHWFVQHLEAVAHLVRTYHHDSMLQETLAELGRVGPPETRPEVDTWYITLRSTLPDFTGLTSAYERFAAQWVDDVAQRVAAHGDLSRKNFLPTAGGIYVVDWDQASLSDPLRDIGPFLWWYVPPDRWTDFFRAYGEDFSAQRAQLYWWVARTSLDVALGLVTHRYGEDALDFLEDFVAAVHHKDNPHGWWRDLDESACEHD